MSWELQGERWRRRGALMFAMTSLSEAVDDLREARVLAYGTRLDEAIAQAEAALAGARKVLEADR